MKLSLVLAATVAVATAQYSPYGFTQGYAQPAWNSGSFAPSFAGSYGYGAQAAYDPYDFGGASYAPGFAGQSYAQPAWNGASSYAPMSYDYGSYAPSYGVQQAYPSYGVQAAPAYDMGAYAGRTINTFFGNVGQVGSSGRVQLNSVGNSLLASNPQLASMLDSILSDTAGLQSFISSRSINGGFNGGFGGQPFGYGGQPSYGYAPQPSYGYGGAQPYGFGGQNAGIWG